MITVRELREEDVNEATVSEIQGLVGVLTSREVTITLEQLQAVLKADVLYVACADEADGGKEGGTIVGMATIVPVVTLMGTHGIVEDVAVSPTQQGKNLGGRLIGALQDHAVRHNLAWLKLTSRPSREAAQRLYAKAGFAERKTIVWRWTA